MESQKGNMQSSNLNFPICAICGVEIKPLGIEKQIARNHEDKMEDELHMIGTELYQKDFKNDQHLKCRIKCAKYFVVGLGARWSKENKYILTANNKEAFEAIEKLKRMGYKEMQKQGIYLYGTPGLGKTHLLASLCKCIINRKANLNDIFWGNTSSILIKLKSSFGKKYSYGEYTVAEHVQEALKRKFVFLDDLGTESATEWTRETLYEAVNYRYDQQLPLFISSNLSPQELAEKMGDKFASRIVEMCKPVRVSGEDIRLQLGNSSEVRKQVLPDFSYQMATWNIKELDA